MEFVEPIWGALPFKFAKPDFKRPVHYGDADDASIGRLERHREDCVGVDKHGKDSGEAERGEEVGVAQIYSIEQYGKEHYRGANDWETKIAQIDIKYKEHKDDWELNFAPYMANAQKRHKEADYHADVKAGNGEDMGKSDDREIVSQVHINRASVAEQH